MVDAREWATIDLNNFAAPLEPRTMPNSGMFPEPFLSMELVPERVLHPVTEPSSLLAPEGQQGPSMGQKGTYTWDEGLTDQEDEPDFGYDEGPDFQL